ncbi:regulatory protein RecX [Methyloglobulus morosus KoM1]|uniref:Regulatory protein RecX n=1 Tax=Methyloglobulus morosus KoM1 TaxID=1116472 RepID=V5BVR9_9GAMM|nr:regulatory protein RecX [Methyloglobulus morosus]ESS71974.1 regulatory protein RecX [Methyloglobulus morosus KoM1]
MKISNSSQQVQTEHLQEIKQIKKECLRLLTRRDHSRKEMQDKLAVKGYNLSQVSQVIDELTRQSWQDDTRYAESYARMRSHKGFGPVRIAFELRQQGIAADVVEKIVYSTPDDWAALLAQVYSKKYPRAGAIDSDERAKRFRFLLQRGFSSAMITDLFNHTLNP